MHIFSLFCISADLWQLNVKVSSSIYLMKQKTIVCRRLRNRQINNYGSLTSARGASSTNEQESAVKTQRLVDTVTLTVKVAHSTYLLILSASALCRLT